MKNILKVPKKNASNDCQTMHLSNQSELNQPNTLLTLTLQITAKTIKINNNKKHTQKIKTHKKHLN